MTQEHHSKKENAIRRAFFPFCFGGEKKRLIAGSINRPDTLRRRNSLISITDCDSEGFNPYASLVQGRLRGLFFAIEKILCNKRSEYLVAFGNSFLGLNYVSAFLYSVLFYRHFLGSVSAKTLFFRSSLCDKQGDWPGGEGSWEFMVGVCHPVLRILTLFQTKKFHYLHPGA